MSAPAIEATLAAYGKLPISREFLWVNVSRGLGRRVRELVDGAARVLAGVAKGEPGLRFYLRTSDGSGAAVGTLWPSSDAGGLRSYPFSLAALFEDGGQGLTPGAFANFDALHRHHQEWYAEAQGLSDAAEFESRFLGRSGEVPAASPAATPVVPGQQLAAAWGGSTKQVALALWKLHLLVRSGGKRLSALQPDVGGLLLPVPARWMVDVADFWLGVLEPVLGLPVHRLEAALRPGGDPRLVLLLRPQSPTDLGIVLDRRAADVVDLTRPRPPRELSGFGGFVRRVEPLLARGGVEAAEIRVLLTGEVS